VPRLFIRKAERAEDQSLQVRPVDTDRSAADFKTVENQVVSHARTEPRSVPFSRR